MENRCDFYERKNTAAMLEVLQFYKLDSLYYSLSEKAMLQFADTFVFGPTSTYDTTLFHLNQLKQQYR